MFLVATTKLAFLSIKSPTIIVGLFCILLLTGCQEKTPEEVTANFWQALAQSQIAIAKELATSNSRDLINLNDIDKHSYIKTGPVIVDDLYASVETTITKGKDGTNQENPVYNIDFKSTDKTKTEQAKESLTPLFSALAIKILDDQAGN